MLSPCLVPVLSFALLVAWGSLYYAFGVLGHAMQQDLHCSAGTLTGAFSVALLVWGLATYPVGVAMDRLGARSVMMLGAVLGAVGLMGLSAASSVGMVYAMWSLLGLAMAMSLYEAAFALVVQSFASGHRRRIGWLTVVGGLASTVFWPLSYYLGQRIGWRATLLLYAALHLLVCVLLLLSQQPSAQPQAATPDPLHRAAPPAPVRDAMLGYLSVCFAMCGFITAAMAVQAIPMLESRGFAPATALGLAACIGPMQVVSRTADLVFGHHASVRRIGMFTLGLMSLSLAALWLAQWLPILSLLFVVAYGLALGLLTVVRAAVPLELAGTERYAANSGMLGAPSLLARAAGPVGAALLAKAPGNPGTVLLVLLLGSLCGMLLFWRAWRFGQEAW
ncbi:MFS transporter [Massilia eburnea]|uniref:MFS transporter n=1 Tax=Massilia eburnea TaxID=1776165 RepID=UPI003D6C6F8C